MKKVCALIVTYNRKQYLEKLLNSLKEQSHSLDTIIIVDNHSTDGTSSLLQQKGLLSNSDISTNTIYNKKVDEINYFYYYNSVNSGGSGGFNKAFEMCISLKEEFDYVWVMDDDVLPEKNCLEILLSYMNDDVKLCIPNRTDDQFKDFPILKIDLKNPFLIKSNKKLLKDTITEDWYFIEDMPFEGPLISYDIVKKVGLPDKDFFIFYDDTDYCHRVLKYTNGKFITKAILHKQIIPQSTNNNGKMNWRNYYFIRNEIYFLKKYGENCLVRALAPQLIILLLFLKSALTFRFYNCKVILLAARDAKNGKRGKTIEPGSI